MIAARGERGMPGLKLKHACPFDPAGRELFEPSVRGSAADRMRMWSSRWMRSRTPARCPRIDAGAHSRRTGCQRTLAVYMASGEGLEACLMNRANTAGPVLPRPRKVRQDRRFYGYLWRFLWILALWPS